jgi:peptidoglycan hydrolase-like protein with peptidoglycan-binding domain
MPLPTMVKGDANLGEVNQYVMLLQRFLSLNNLLKRDGSGRDPVNGRFDDATELAVRRFHEISKLPPTGTVDGRTWAAIAGVSQPLKVTEPINLLLELPVLRSGDQNTLVTVLQRLLVEYSGSQPGQAFIPPGIIAKADVENGRDTFGEKTRLAVEAFQANRGIPVDGEVGETTWEKLLFPKGRT